jgi:N-acetylglucosaminyldiphosphoundecaprenol N-acetyl-beta-D-mannosaminyltransferase
MKKTLTVHVKEGLSQKYVKILGVRVTSTSVPGVLRKIAVDIKRGHKFFIVTPNPEIVMAAQDDDDLMNALNKADISIPDGIGLVAAYKFMTLPTPKGTLLRTMTLLAQGLGVGFSIIFDRDFVTSELKVIRGRELFLDLVKLSNKKGWKVYLLGGEHSEAIGTKKVLEANFKNVAIKARQGPMLFNDGLPRTKKDAEEEVKCIEEINDFSPELLFVCFNHRKQEKWLYRHLSDLKVGGGMVLGGTFKYVTGIQKLPPKFIADSGLEWMWRLATGSQKVGRVVKAFPQFPLKIFLTKLTK